MPTYEYRCDHCDRNFDVVQSFQDEPLSTCPTCGAPVRKVFGNVGIVFKGSGFYKTDSRNGSSPKGSDSKDGSAGDSGSKSTEASSNGSGSSSKGSSSGDGSSSGAKTGSKEASTSKSASSD